MTSEEFSHLDMQEQNLLLRSLLEKLPHIVFLYSLSEKRNLFINNSVYESLGYTIQEVHEMGANVLDALLHPDDAQLVKDLDEKYRKLKSGETYTHVGRWQAKHGKVFYYNNIIIPFRFAKNGDCEVVMGIAEDISSFMEFKEDLVRNTASLQDVIADISHKLRHDHSRVLGILELAYFSKKGDMQMDDFKLLSDGLLSSAQNMDEEFRNTTQNIYTVKEQLARMHEKL